MTLLCSSFPSQVANASPPPQRCHLSDEPQGEQRAAGSLHGDATGGSTRFTTSGQYCPPTPNPDPRPLLLPTHKHTSAHARTDTIYPAGLGDARITASHGLPRPSLLHPSPLHPLQMVPAYNPFPFCLRAIPSFTRSGCTLQHHRKGSAPPSRILEG